MGRTMLTQSDYFRSPRTENICILRHDVEWGCINSFRQAELEARRGIRASYYFHGPHRPKVFQPKEMERFVQLGHEVGYHYEVLDQTDGNFEKAKAIFEDELRQFRDAGFPTTTVCAHGNPRKRKIGYKSNYDILKRYPNLLTEQELLGEASTSFFPTEEIFSVSDTGASMKASVKSNAVPVSGGTVKGLLDILHQSDPYLLHILTHPDYWSAGPVRAHALSMAGSALRVMTRGARAGLSLLR